MKLTLQQIRNLDTRVRAHMVVNGQLAQADVTAALADIQPGTGSAVYAYPDLADKADLCMTADPSFPDD